MNNDQLFDYILGMNHFVLKLNNLLLALIQDFLNDGKLHDDEENEE